MILNSNWQALRDCCRDDAAFARLRQLLETRKNGSVVNLAKTGLRAAAIEPIQPSGEVAIPQATLLQGIVEAISQLLTSSNYTAAIDTALAILGKATGIDRVYIFDIHPHPATGEPATSQQFEWVRESIAPQIDNPRLQNRGFVSGGLIRWYTLLQQGQSLNAIVRELPDAEQLVLVVQDIQSVLIVPIQVDGGLWGFVGFDDCSRERHWSAGEEAALQIMAASLGGAIARQQSEARNQAMVNAIPDLMFRIHRDGTYLDCKAEHDSDTLMPPSELIGRSVYDVLPAALAQQRMHYVEKALTSGTNQRFEYQLQFDAAGRASPSLNSLPETLRDYEARVVVCGEDEVLAIVRDITDRQLAEKALRLSEEKFAKAFRSSPNPMSISTLRNGRIIEVNESFLHTSGYSRAEVVGRDVAEINLWVNPADRLRVIQPLQQGDRVQNLECQFRVKSGEILTMLVSAEAIDIDGEACILSVVVDITERIQAQQQLWAAAERDRLLRDIALRIRQSLDLQKIFSTTVAEVRQFLHTDRVYIEHNNAEGFSVVVAESVDSHYPSILGKVFDDLEQAQEIQTLFANGQIQVIDDIATEEFALCDNTSYFTEYQIQAAMAAPIMLDNQVFGLLVANQCSNPRHWEAFEMELMRQLATQVAIALQQAQLYQQVQTLNASLEQQVSDRTAELQQRMEELQELNELKDEFLNAFSHDLRTPIMGISLVLNNLLNQSGEMISINRSILERMVQSGNHQLQLINSLLQAHSAETRGVILNYELVQLSLLLQVIVEDLEPLLVKNQAKLINQVPPDLPLVNADPLQLRRVFENLITNALNHNPPGIQLILGAAIEAELIRITLRDDGVGMAEEVRDRLFDRYSRGRNSRHSTGIGLGLYLCRQIITAHGGQIGVEGVPNQGATFWLTLPLAISSTANTDPTAIADA